MSHHGDARLDNVFERDCTAIHPSNQTKGPVSRERPGVARSPDRRRRRATIVSSDSPHPVAPPAPPAASAGVRALVAAVLGLVLYQMSRLWFYTVDDSFIIARYARNVAEGHGLVFNIGDHQWGATTTLFPIMLAPAHWLGLDVVTAAKTMGGIALLASCWLVVKTVGRHTTPWLAVLAAVPIAGFTPLVLWSVSGMETAVFFCLVTAALTAGCWERDLAQPPRVPPSALLLLAAALTRPDAPLYAPAVLITAVNWGDRRQAGRWLATVGTGFALLWGLHLLYYGSMVPNTFLAKVAGLDDRVGPGWTYLTTFAQTAAPLLVAATVGGALTLWLGGARLRQDLLGFAVALGLCLAYPVYIGGDWMPMHRFLSGAVLFGVPLVFWGATAVGGRVPVSRPVFQTITVVLVLLLTLATTARTPNNLRLRGPGDGDGALRRGRRGGAWRRPVIDLCLGRYRPGRVAQPGQSARPARSGGT